MKPIELEQVYYLLGNKTAEFIERSRGSPVSVNAVIIVESEFNLEDGEQDAGESNEEEAGIVISESLGIEPGLEKVFAEKFKEEEKKYLSFKQLWERDNKPNGK